MYDRKTYPAYHTLKKIRRNVLDDKAVIHVTDFGSGSRVFSSNERKVSAIAKNAGVTYKRQKLLFRMAQYFKPTALLELGTSLGLGTAALSLGNPSGNITTVEGCPNISQRATQVFEGFQLKNINLQNNTFEDFFKTEATPAYDLIYVDGNHDKEKTLQYFEVLLEKTQNDSLIIFDDIYWSKGMTEAWDFIVQHPKITVSIDLFYWGLVFFRREQKKQHFRIRL
ncbi:MAG: class I SAM-dependent methyltransferase [Flavobacteriaceae bacterium]